MKECNNVFACHDPITLDEDNQVLRVFCKTCKNIYIIRKDWRGVPENRQYSEIFRKEILQGNDNLFYKYYPQYIRK